MEETSERRGAAPYADDRCLAWLLGSPIHRVAGGSHLLLVRMRPAGR